MSIIKVSDKGDLFVTLSAKKMQSFKNDFAD